LDNAGLNEYHCSGENAGSNLIKLLDTYWGA